MDRFLLLLEDRDEKKQISPPQEQVKQPIEAICSVMWWSQITDVINV